MSPDREGLRRLARGMTASVYALAAGFAAWRLIDTSAPAYDDCHPAGALMGDAPPCSSCGHMTVRNGACYVCLTCGDTTGCS